MRKLSDVVWLAVISAVTGLAAVAAGILEGNWTLGLGLASIASAVLVNSERR
jgi:uncharacterized membrane protein (UPF0136 family)